MIGIGLSYPTPNGMAAESFTFTPIESSFPSLKTTDARDRLKKWNLDCFMQAAAFRFDQPFSQESTDAFLFDLFASQVVQEAAPVCVAPGQWKTLGSLLSGAVKYVRLPTTVLRMDFFDRLEENGIVRAGDIAKCLDTQVGEVLVSDKLRLLMLDESSDEWELFTEAERSELIFHVLKILAVGGGMNQYDDQINPYLTLAKSIYKDLVTVHRTAAGSLQIGSLAFMVSEICGSGANLFPRLSPNNYCYVTVDPAARHVKIWYGAFYPMM